MQRSSSVAAADSSGGPSAVKTLSLTAAQIRELSQHQQVTAYETRDRTEAYFQPWPVERVVRYKCMLRGWFETEYLDFLPEATDAQLRRLMWEEKVATKRDDSRVRFFWTHLSSHAQGATCRFLVADHFRDSLRVIRKYAELQRSALGDDEAVKAALAQWVTQQKINYSSRGFRQLIRMDSVEMAPEVPDALRQTLAARRAADERPGRGLLRRAADVAAAERDAWLRSTTDAYFEDQRRRGSCVAAAAGGDAST